MRNKNASQLQNIGWLALGCAIIALGVSFAEIGAANHVIAAFYVVGVWAMARAVINQGLSDFDRLTTIAAEARVARSDELVTVREIGRLMPYQVDLINNKVIPLGGGINPAFKLEGAMPGRDLIRRETLAAFIRSSTPEYCAPLRQFSDGLEREEVQSLMDWLKQNGHIAVPAAGNRAAMWTPGAYLTVKTKFGG